MLVGLSFTKSKSLVFKGVRYCHVFKTRPLKGVGYCHTGLRLGLSLIEKSTLNAPISGQAPF